MPVRRADQADWETIRAVRLQALLDAPEAFASTYADNVARPDEHWLTWLSPMSTFLHKSADGEPQGMVAAWIPPEFPERCHLMARWVDPTARGTGAAAELLDAASNWGRAEGATIVEIEVYDTNGEAIRFYERNGFAPTGHTRDRDSKGRTAHSRQRPL